MHDIQSLKMYKILTNPFHSVGIIFELSIVAMYVCNSTSTCTRISIAQHGNGKWIHVNRKFMALIENPLHKMKPMHSKTYEYIANVCRVPHKVGRKIEIAQCIAHTKSTHARGGGRERVPFVISICQYRF